MMTETIRAFDGLEMECTNTTSTTIWVSPEYWSVARDKNTAIIHIEVAKISGTGTTVTLVCQDSSGRIFADINLTGTYTMTAKGTIRYVLTNFAAHLKVGLTLSCSSGTGNASVALEYTLMPF